VTIPKVIAERHGLRPGDEIKWISAGDTIRVEPAEPKTSQYPGPPEALRRGNETAPPEEVERGGSEAPRMDPRGALRTSPRSLTRTSWFILSIPNEAIVRTAWRGAAAYQLNWFDAHLWAYAEHYGLSELISEDFEDGRLYGAVRATNPF